MAGRSKNRPSGTRPPPARPLIGAKGIPPNTLAGPPAWTGEAAPRPVPGSAVAAGLSAGAAGLSAGAAAAQDCGTDNAPISAGRPVPADTAAAPNPAEPVDPSAPGPSPQPRPEVSPLVKPDPEAVWLTARRRPRPQRGSRPGRGDAGARRGYGDEFMDTDIDPDWGAPPGEEPVASTVGSDQDAGPLGFAGTVRKDGARQAAGETVLAEDEFGGGPRIPMLPGTWDPGRAGEAGEAGERS